MSVQTPAIPPLILSPSTAMPLSLDAIVNYGGRRWYVGALACLGGERYYFLVASRGPNADVAMIPAMVLEGDGEPRREEP